MRTWNRRTTTGDPLDAGEHDTADAELTLGWSGVHAQPNLGNNTDDRETTALERHGKGFVRSGPDDAEDDGTGEPGDGAWESGGAHDQSRWCAAVSPPAVYSMRVSGDCCDPVIPDGSLIVIDAEASFEPGDFVAIHHDDPASEHGISSKVKKLDGALWIPSLPIVGDVEFQAVISARMLNPPRRIFYESDIVHAVHKVVKIERPQAGEGSHV